MKKLFSWTIERMLFERRQSRKAHFLNNYNGNEAYIDVYASQHANEILGVESGGDITNAKKTLTRWLSKHKGVYTKADAAQTTKLPRIRFKRFAIKLHTL